FAAMNDPSSGVSVTVLSQFYLLLSTLLFLAIDGHIIVIQMLVDSFATFPVGGSGLSTDNFLAIVGLGSWMFNAGLVISLPLFTALLVVNMSFGVMSRSAPQMNVFTVGFPITLILGLLIMWFSLANFLPLFEGIIEDGLYRVLNGMGMMEWQKATTAVRKKQKRPRPENSKKRGRKARFPDRGISRLQPFYWLGLSAYIFLRAL